MLIIAAIILILLVDCVLFAYDKYILSAAGFLAVTVGAYMFIPDVAALVATYGYVEVGLAYLGFGLLVALGKWVATSIKHGIRVREIRQEFDESSIGKNTDVTQVLRRRHFAELWNSRTQYTGPIELNPQISIPSAPHNERVDNSRFENEDYIVDQLMIKARNNIDRITFWVLQWPIVIVTTAFEDLIVNIGKNAARMFDFMLTRVSRMMITSSVKGL